MNHAHDTKALEMANEAMKLFFQPMPGVQLLAKLQCMFIDAMEFAVPEAGNSPVIPDGWVMVPVEPTEDMVIKGFESEPDEFWTEELEWRKYQMMSGCRQAAHKARLCWAAMIAAAPQQEQTRKK